MNDFSITAFQSGDGLEFEKISKRYRPQVKYFLLRLTMNRADAELITELVFSKLLIFRERFASLANIQAFLFVAAREVFCQHRRMKNESTENDKICQL